MITLTIAQLLTGAVAINALGQLDKDKNSALVRWKGGTIKKVLAPEVVRAQAEQRALYTKENSVEICPRCGVELPAAVEDITRNAPASPRKCLNPKCDHDASANGYAMKVRPGFEKEFAAKHSELMEVSSEYHLPTFTLDELENTPLTGDDMVALGGIVDANTAWESDVSPKATQKPHVAKKREQK